MLVSVAGPTGFFSGLSAQEVNPKLTNRATMSSEVVGFMGVWIKNANVSAGDRFFEDHTVARLDAHAGSQSFEIDLGDGLAGFDG
jgi:hypothetical protein